MAGFGLAASVSGFVLVIAGSLSWFAMYGFELLGNTKNQKKEENEEVVKRLFSCNVHVVTVTLSYLRAC